MRNELIIKGAMYNHEYVEISNLINQLGKLGLNCRTTDHVFNLKSLINKYVFNNKKKLYSL